MKFSKKPVVIEAIKYQAKYGNNRVMNWNGCPHCWEAGIRSPVERVPEIPGPERFE